MTPSFAKSIFIEEFKNHIHYEYLNQSFAQEGEDMILNKLLEGKKNGFYIDVGAHHPFKYSNTYYFYKKGWKGINIDPLPGSMAMFDQYRPLDTNLEIAISLNPGELEYHMFDIPVLNSFSKEAVAYAETKWKQKVRSTKKVYTESLANVLRKYQHLFKTIDFMSIDVEGYDLEVLQSNDWNQFKPSFLLIEDRDINLSNLHESLTFVYLKDQGYSLISKTCNTCFYQLTIS
jgi:FkbM family methyltransferase